MRPSLEKLVADSERHVDRILAERLDALTLDLIAHGHSDDEVAFAVEHQYLSDCAWKAAALALWEQALASAHAAGMFDSEA